MTVFYCILKFFHSGTTDIRFKYGSSASQHRESLETIDLPQPMKSESSLLSFCLPFEFVKTMRKISGIRLVLDLSDESGKKGFEQEWKNQ